MHKIKKGELMTEFNTTFYSDPESLAGKLERHLKRKGVKEIGSIKKSSFTKYEYERRIDKDKSWIPLENYSRFDRAKRTVYIKQLTMDAVKRVHAAEIANGRLFDMLTEYTKMKKAAKESMEFREISDEEASGIYEFNKKNAPILDSEYDGHKIPPYFYYDLEFDGILYHHAWDWNVWPHILEIKKARPKTLAEAVGQLGGSDGK